MAEAFFATLKAEFYYRRVWPTKKRARLEVGKWIEDRYNRRCRHSSLGQISPVNFEMPTPDEDVVIVVLAPDYRHITWTTVIGIAH